MEFAGESENMRRLCNVFVAEISMAQGVLSFPAQISSELWHRFLCSRSGSCLAQISLPHHNFDNQISFLKVCCHVLPGVSNCFNVLVLVLVTQVIIYMRARALFQAWGNSSQNWTLRH